MENNKFIDLDGLKLIWNKIDNLFNATNAKITELTNEVKALKEQIANNGTDPSEPKIPNGYVLPQDSDFKWEENLPWNGAWHYIGKADKVAVPHTINGKKVTSYRGMFVKTSVNGVYSDNHDVKDMSEMFSESTATSLDLSSFDISNVTNMEGMFWDSKAQKGYARNQEEANRFNALGDGDKPLELVFVVKQ